MGEFELARWWLGALFGGVLFAMVVGNCCVPESSVLREWIRPEGTHVEVTTASACQVLEAEIKRGLARYGVGKPPSCPSRTGVILHQPDKNEFFLRDVAKVTVGGVEKLVPFSATARYEIDELRRPIWTSVRFQSEGAL